jgi:hypothetical protein
MATTYKVLGQSEPAATTPADLYTVPAATSTIVSSLSICNRDTSPGTFRISVRPAGASQADQHYLTFDAPISAKDTLILTVGLTLAATDVLTVYSSNADTAFQAFGSELT